MARNVDGGHLAVAHMTTTLPEQARTWLSDTNFATDRPEWAGASGVALLTETAALVRAAGFEIANASVQVIGVRPRIGRRRAEAERALGDAIGAPVSVSGTTSDGLGLTGRAEGLAAVATALLLTS